MDVTKSCGFGSIIYSMAGVKSDTWLRSLVLRTQLGDVNAFSRLIRTYERMAWGYAYAHVADVHLAEDICQEAFVDAYQKIDTLREPLAFPRWLKTIVRKHADRAFRGSRFVYVPFIDDTKSDLGYVRPDELLEREEELDRVRKLLSPLPPAQRITATLCYVDGCNIKQFATFLGIATGTVRKRLYDARKSLMRILRTEDLEKMEHDISSLLARHLSPKLVQRVLADPSVVKQKGERRVLSTLFVDASGITRIQESISPELAIAFLNDYLEAVYQVVIDHDGFMDKVVGDEIMAFWGAPLTIENSAEAACGTALAIQKRLAELREENRKSGKPEISARIGINTGEAIIGTYGPVDFPAYTPMGHSVNLGARMEGVARRLEEPIVITEFTRTLLGDEFTVKELDTVQLKSRDEPICVFGLVDGPK